MAPKPPSPRKTVVGIDFGKLVYVPHEIDGFQLGKLVDIRSDGLAVEVLGTQDIIKVDHDEVFPADDNQRTDVDDNCALMYLNEATLLHNCKIRYKRKQIYTYVANILISINPYEQIPDLYSQKTIKSYMGKSLGTMAPHVFAIADMAYRDMKRLKRSQSVIVSGESGAGKTESQKSILRYLCDCWGAADGRIEQRLLETNPILEAFGNAKTLRNNNSSRFGKFVEIHFNTKNHVAGGFVSHYLLEKSRLCHQTEGERNYHIFYQLLAGADEATMKEWNLGSPDKFRYLAGGCTQFFASAASKSKIPTTRYSRDAVKVLTDDLVDDYADFHRLRKSLMDTGISESKRDNIFKVIAGILHLGNIEFEDNAEDSKGGCMISTSSSTSLKHAAKLLGVDTSELLNGLITRVMQPAKGGVMGTIIRVPLKPREASNARDALTKAIYNRIFDVVVSSINRSIPFTDSVNYIGVLDIAGFEFFAVNSFEQFCINYCNEKLQQFFNDRILRQEQDLYAKEGLNVPRIEFADNQDCIELFEEKPTGLLDLLDEEARLPKPSPQHFTEAVHRAQKNHFRLCSPRKSKLREHRDMREDEGFLIRHYAGTVCYQTSQFLDKNNDALHMSLEMLMEMSSNSLIAEIFKPSPEAIKAASKSRPTGNKLAFASVSSKFRSQLAQLLEKLRITGTHFVRCIKPNSTMEPSKFDGAQILSQLKCAGMASVLKLMQKGFPSRTSFADLYGMYKDLLPPKLKRLDPRLFCKCLFHALGLNDIDFKFGMTRVFFRPGKFAEFDQLMRQDKESMSALIAKVNTWLHRMRWKKVQYGAWSVIKLDRKIKYRAAALIKIQSSVRGFLTRKRQLPRLSAFKRAKALQNRFSELGPLGSKLSDKSKQLWLAKIQSFSQGIKQLIANIQDPKAFNPSQASQICARLDVELDSMMKEIRVQAAADEKEKMKKMEAKMRAEKERQITELREKEAQDKRLKELRDLEAKRQFEEEKLKQKAKESEVENAAEVEAQARRLKQLEQERLDAELARRIAAEEGQSFDNSGRLNGAMNNNNKSVAIVNGTKVDLSTWTYAQLRDTINTSNNIELLFACRQELNSRLQSYHQWKSHNEATSYTNPFARAPDSVMAHGARLHPEMSSTKAPPPIQRFFRVPIRPSTDASAPSPASAGLWYAHFDGQFVARQMELKPNKPPILLLAGRDDPKMCELTLEQTQLTRKKGAEILASEFEALWQKYGGQPFYPNLKNTRM